MTDRLTDRQTFASLESRVAFATEKRLNDFLVLNDFSVLEKTKKSSFLRILNILRF